jgi:hypothetical protein
MCARGPLLLRLRRQSFRQRNPIRPKLCILLDQLVRLRDQVAMAEARQRALRPQELRRLKPGRVASFPLAAGPDSDGSGATPPVPRDASLP